MSRPARCISRPLLVLSGRRQSRGSVESEQARHGTWIAVRLCEGGRGRRDMRSSYQGQSSKFWEIALKGKGHVVTWGRIGTDGRSLKKTFPSSDAARARARQAGAREICARGTCRWAARRLPPRPPRPPRPRRGAIPVVLPARQPPPVHGRRRRSPGADASRSKTWTTSWRRRPMARSCTCWRAACEIPIVIEVLAAPPAQAELEVPRRLRGQLRIDQRDARRRLARSRRASPGEGPERRVADPGAAGGPRHRQLR